jgi:hypothetical protein
VISIAHTSGYFTLSMGTFALRRENFDAVPDGFDHYCNFLIDRDFNVSIGF